MVLFFRNSFEAICVLWKRYKYKSEKVRSRVNTKFSLRGSPGRQLSAIKHVLFHNFLRAYGSKGIVNITEFFSKILNYGTFENSIVKSIFGFTCGVIMSYIVFIYLLPVTNMKFSAVLCMTFVLGTFFMQGLAFSERARCLILLILPQFFTRQGKHVLLTYTFYLSSIPVKNTLINANVIADGIICKQKQLGHRLQRYIDLVENPTNFLRDKLSEIKYAVDELAAETNKKLLAAERLFYGTVDIIKTAKEWLESIGKICSTEVGTPFQRCKKLFEGLVDDCTVRLGPAMRWACAPAYAASNVCYTVKEVDVVCGSVAFVNDAFFATITLKMKRFVLSMKEMTYADVRFDHSFSINATQNDTFLIAFFEVYIKDLQNMFRYLFYAIDFSNFLVPFFTVYMIYSVFRFHNQYLNRMNFDNVFISEDFIKIDSYRGVRGLPSLLPLTKRESNKYVYLTDFSLLEKEKRKIFVSSIGTIVATFQIGIFVLIDWIFYWLAAMLKSFDKYFNEFDDEFQTMKVEVQGNNVIGKYLRKVIGSLEPDILDFVNDRCTINGSRPNTEIEFQLFFLTLGMLLLQVAEPFALRTRQIIMKVYHPNESIERSVWLYSHILQNRKQLSKEMARSSKRKFSSRFQKPSLSKQLKKLLSFRFAWLNYFGIFGGFSKRYCNNCSNPLLYEEIFRCMNELCDAVYCKDCYYTDNNVCVFCFCPFTFFEENVSFYADEETDSSDEEAKMFSATSPAEDYKSEEEALSSTGTGKEIVFTRYRYRDNRVDGNEEASLRFLFHEIPKGNEDGLRETSDRRSFSSIARFKTIPMFTCPSEENNDTGVSWPGVNSAGTKNKFSETLLLPPIDFHIDKTGEEYDETILAS